MSSQKNSEASPDAGAGGASRGGILGERTAGLQGHRDLPLIASVSLAPEGRPGPAAADRRDRGDAGSVRVSAGPGPSSARGLARQSQADLPDLLRGGASSEKETSSSSRLWKPADGAA